MELKWFDSSTGSLRRNLTMSVIFLFLVACGAGTEVVNTPNPNETPPVKKFETPYYSVILEIPEGWTYIDYTTGIEPGEEAFVDSDEETATLAHFSYPDRGYFTIFASHLEEGESLVEYVRDRRSTGDIQITIVESDDGQKGTLAFIDQEEPGPHGGYVLDLYLSVESDVLWMRTELLGTAEEMEDTLEEFFDIVGSAKIE